MSKGNKNTYQNSQNAAKAAQKGKFVVINNYIVKKRCQMNNLTLYLKNPKKKNKLIPKLAEGRK